LTYGVLFAGKIINKEPFAELKVKFKIKRKTTTTTKTALSKPTRSMRAQPASKRLNTLFPINQKPCHCLHGVNSSGLNTLHY